MASVIHRILGAFVISSSLMVTVLTLLVFDRGWIFDYDEMGWILSPLFLISIVISGVGGVMMLVLTKRTIWALTIIAPLGSIAVLLGIASAMI